MKTQLFAFVEDSTADALSAALEDLGTADWYPTGRLDRVEKQWLQVAKEVEACTDEQRGLHLSYMLQADRDHTAGGKPFQHLSPRQQLNYMAVYQKLRSVRICLALDPAIAKAAGMKGITDAKTPLPLSSVRDVYNALQSRNPLHAHLHMDLQNGMQNPKSDWIRCLLPDKGHTKASSAVRLEALESSCCDPDGHIQRDLMELVA